MINKNSRIIEIKSIIDNLPNVTGMTFKKRMEEMYRLGAKAPSIWEAEMLSDEKWDDLIKNIKE
jgi:hypothetical protein